MLYRDHPRFYMQECAFLKWLVGRWGTGKHKHTDNDGDDEDTFSKVPHLDANDVEMLLNEFVFFKKEELLILSIRL